jgi:hypothetical protein
MTMIDYEGSANHAQTLSSFVFRVQEIIAEPDISAEQKIETIQNLLVGPDVIKVASMARDGLSE